MPRVAFTANLQRHISAPSSEVAGRTVRAALESVFAANPRLRNYVLDDQGRVRHHVVVQRRSTSWQEVPNMVPSVFGFAVAVHPQDPDTAWFVPAIKDERRVPVDGALVVTRTRDGGKSCTVLREGLPQQHAYDLVYRHGLDVDESGNRLAFGSTTGSAWVTENQGDSWRCISTHLPPINCVRFAR